MNTFETTASPAVPGIGDSAPERTFGPLSRTDFVRYQGASGDFHPLHHDEPYAQRAGFPSVFSVGMLQAGLLASFATDWLGADTIRRYTMRFVEQCWPGDELTCSGVVTAVSLEPAGGSRVTVDLRCVRQTGSPAIVASAEFLFD